jgi:cyclic pyranopterin phosphate synthase
VRVSATGVLHTCLGQEDAVDLKTPLRDGGEPALNAVALAGTTEHEVFDLIQFAHGQGMDLTFIETMPLGDVGVDRIDQYLPLDRLRALIETRLDLADTAERTGGPARYARVEQTGGRRRLPQQRTQCAALPPAFNHAQ